MELKEEVREGRRRRGWGEKRRVTGVETQIASYVCRPLLGTTKTNAIFHAQNESPLRTQISKNLLAD